MPFNLRRLGQVEEGCFDRGLVHEEGKQVEDPGRLARSPCLFLHVLVIGQAPPLPLVGHVVTVTLDGGVHALQYYVQQASVLELMD